MELFDLGSGVWSELNDMPRALADHYLVPYGNRLMAVGVINKGTSNCVLEMGNLEEKGEWKEQTEMVHTGLYLSTAKLGKEIFLIGGTNGTQEWRGVDVYNGKRWRSGPSLPCSSCSLSAVAIPHELADLLSPNRI